MPRRTLTPPKPKHKKKRKSKSKKDSRSFPRKTMYVVFAILPVWTLNISRSLWHVFDHESKFWIIISRLFIAIFIIPFLWLGMIGLYSLMLIPAITYGLFAIYIWASHTMSKRVGNAALDAFKKQKRR